MVKGLQLQQQTLPPDATQLIDQLERHCFAPDGSLVSKSAYYDLQFAREEMFRERLCYLEAMAIYSEAIAMVEDYQQGFINSPQLYETLEHRMIIAEAAQRLRLPLISKDGEIHQEEIENCSIISWSSLDSTNAGVTLTSSSSATNYTANGTSTAANNRVSTDVMEPGIGGVSNCFLGITPAYLWQTQSQQTPFYMDMSEFQLWLSCEIEDGLEAKCDKLADAFSVDDIDSSSEHQNSGAPLPERVKLIIEDVEREEAALQEDLYSADRKFSEYYNVLEQMLGVLIKLVRELKLQHQHKYDELQKTWLCKRCETMSAKLRKLEYALLGETYTKKSAPALHIIRKYLVDATEEASITYDKSVARLREYRGVDPQFHKIARQYDEIVKKLENMQWTINQVEMDLKRLPDHPNA